MYMCSYCPFRGRVDGLTCPRWPSNHDRYCEWVDPASNAYRPDRAETLVRIARARLAGGASPVLSPVTIPGGEERARVLAKIAACPERGKSLPISEQPECGCAELYECRAGVGGGKVTTGDCWKCIAKYDIRI